MMDTMFSKRRRVQINKPLQRTSVCVHICIPITFQEWYVRWIVENLGYGRIFAVLSESFFSLYYELNETAQPRMTYDKSSVSFSPFFHVSTCPFLMLFFSLELLGFMNLTQPSPSPCHSTPLNHIYCAQSQPLICALEIQTDLCKTDLCVLIFFLNYSPVSTSAPIC